MNTLVWVRLGVQEEQQNKGMQDWRKLVPTYSSLATSSILFWELGYSHESTICSVAKNRSSFRYV